jgi:phenylalanyl-tRNA synthetase alpha chain
VCFGLAVVCVQIEGVVADYGLGLPHLIATISDFFRRVGISDIKFKPAFNPYTEPSMEVRAVPMS